MPITSGDIEIRLSVTGVGTGNITGQPNPNLSLGGFMSTTEIVDNTLNNLFDDISGDENAESDVEYRCIFIFNTHGTLTLQNTKCWISNEVSGGASVAIGLDPNGVVSGNATLQALAIADEDTAPTGISFSSPTVKASGLSVGNVTASGCHGIWVRRTAANTAAKNNDGATLSFAGDTAE